VNPKINPTSVSNKNLNERKKKYLTQVISVKNKAEHTKELRSEEIRQRKPSKAEQRTA